MVDKKKEIFSKSEAAADKKESQEERSPLNPNPGFTKAEPKEDPNPTEVKVGAASEDGVQTQQRGKATPKEELEFTVGKHKYHAWPTGNVPTGQWGVSIWSRGPDTQEYPAFLDNHGEWWWATTTNQNGVNPAVEKTEEPVGWRIL